MRISDKTNREELSPVPESEFERVLEEDLSEAREELQAREAASPRHTNQETWQQAGRMIKEFRPVPWPLWVMIRSVLGSGEGVKLAESSVFAPAEPIVDNALQDLTLGQFALGIDNVSGLPLSERLKLLKPDVGAALAFIYSVCRRVTSSHNERIWRPILDDALLRAQIGYFVGARNENFGVGRGMVAGFSGRSGLAIQIASGTERQAERSIEFLALGREISEVGLSTYACEPLQVSAMALVAAGLPHQAAYGTARFERRHDTIQPDSLEYRWLSALTITEHMRTGNSEMIRPEHWAAVGFNQGSARDALQVATRQLLRRGHSWRFLTDAVLAH